LVFGGGFEAKGREVDRRPEFGAEGMEGRAMAVAGLGAFGGDWQRVFDGVYEFARATLGAAWASSFVGGVWGICLG
jgi:hypothetical protein